MDTGDMKDDIGAEHAVRGELENLPYALPQLEPVGLPTGMPWPEGLPETPYRPQPTLPASYRLCFEEKMMGSLGCLPPWDPPTGGGCCPTCGQPWPGWGRGYQPFCGGMGPTWGEMSERKYPDGPE